MNRFVLSDWLYDLMLLIYDKFDWNEFGGYNIFINPLNCITDFLSRLSVFVRDGVVSE